MERLKGLQEKIEKNLNLLEMNLVSSGHKFVAGDTITLADFTLFSQMEDMNWLGRSLDKWPGI